jgi:L-serine dehydratase
MNWNLDTATGLCDKLDAAFMSPEEFAIKRQIFRSGTDEKMVSCELDREIATTRDAINYGLSTPQITRSGLVQGAAISVATTADRGLIHDGLYRRAITYALAINEVNASYGKILCFPTAGSSGIPSGVIWAWFDRHEKAMIPHSSLKPPFTANLRGAFLVAGMVKEIIAIGATLAGSEGGCQAECGAAGAMAACALAYLEGLPLRDSFSAAALSLKNSLGLACDPVAGLVEVPCVKRNAFVAVQSIVAVDLTLAGVKSCIPFDEVVVAMRDIGAAMPRCIKETGEGGLAKTSTGKSIEKQLGDDPESANFYLTSICG